MTGSARGEWQGGKQIPIANHYYFTFRFNLLVPFQEVIKYDVKEWQCFARSWLVTIRQRGELEWNRVDSPFPEESRVKREGDCLRVLKNERANERREEEENKLKMGRENNTAVSKGKQLIVQRGRIGRGEKGKLREEDMQKPTQSQTYR